MYYILNTAFTKPLRHLGTFITTIFITHYPFPHHHLNRQKYPNRTSSASSITAIIAIGRNAPAITPRQKARQASPDAFEQPFVQKLSIYLTSVSFYYIIFISLKDVINYL